MKMNTLTLKTSVIAVTLTLVTLASAGATVLYQQNFDMTGNAYSSQNDTASFGNFATVFDNFTLGSNGSIGNVMWTGEYFNPPAQGPITAWTLTFYADVGGMPGGSLMSYNVAGNGMETFLGNFAGFPTYTYSLDLGTAFNALGGTQYWLSVVPDLAFPPQWGWSSGTGGDGISYQDFFGSRSQLAADMAFTLNSAPSGVPESGSTVVFFGAAILVLGVLGRRKLAVRA
jgi:hypothetical protein